MISIFKRRRPCKDKKTAESCFPPEIFHAIIDELKDDTIALKQISLVSKGLSPRTRVHLFSSANISSKADCDRLRKLITYSPGIAHYFTALSFEFRSRTIARSLPAKILNTLVNLSKLTLSLGDFSNLRPSVIFALAARSYKHLAFILVDFDSVSDICALTRNSASMKSMSIVAPRFFGTPVPCDHEGIVPSPTFLGINDGESDAGVVLVSILSPRECPISLKRVENLVILISHTNPAFVQQLNYFLIQIHAEQPLPSLDVTHTTTVTPTETLHISRVKTLMIDISKYNESDQPKSILSWWITAFRATDADAALEAVSLKIDVKDIPSLSGPDHGDLWKQMDDALRGIRSLRTLEIVFYNVPPEWPWNEAEAQIIEGFKMREPRRGLVIEVTAFSSSPPLLM
ncbi:hypothetical protein ARMGADRAFT_732098 [Armillaria gallica]|uniref:F-box domain-containing protein n=1 Tax=Armillaria gallica TaxID=47427 RepID=A0A2H3CMC8_ARMGA|nr:hypothetical protein ARMGADRAFT_732098 [Armillaria gallica]